MSAQDPKSGSADPAARHDTVMTILGDALELPLVERAAFLDHACAGDIGLRSEVERLLRGEADANRAIPTESPIHSHARSPAVPAPARIGRYRIVRQLGRGGMGIVYLAEQEQPMRRTVALKVIRPGMDTNEVVARFQSERQALAMMDHPNVARVFDAGATNAGRLYFVMDYVPGEPITSYCDNHQLTNQQRLELFIQVCKGIEHAHQKGIVHRDIKPSNVLVSESDGAPLARVIDFGIAKAVSQKLTDRTLHTQHGQLMGTPEYMSPEQAESSG